MNPNTMNYFSNAMPVKNKTDQHLSGYTLQTRVATFNLTFVSILIATLQRHSNPMHTAAGI